MFPLGQEKVSLRIQHSFTLKFEPLLVCKLVEEVTVLLKAVCVYNACYLLRAYYVPTTVLSPFYI